MSLMWSVMCHRCGRSVSLVECHGGSRSPLADGWRRCGREALHIRRCIPQTTPDLQVCCHKL